MSPAGRVKLLYIAGWGRSGTTLMDNLLGQLDGCVSTGELHNLWQRGIIDARDCGCGRRLKDCDWWASVFERGLGGVSDADATAAIRAQQQLHTRHAPAVYWRVRRGRANGHYEYAKHLAGLYEGIRLTSKARVIVDSSKFPSDAILAAGLPGVDLHVLHMVRDPRAVAFSWRRKKEVADKPRAGGLLPRVSMLRSTVVWQVYNIVIGTLVARAAGRGRYHLVAYEAFATSPAQTLRDVMNFLGEERTSVPEIEEGVTQMAASHTAGGNPNRFRTGETKISLDNEWSRAMPRWKRLLVSAMSWPTLRLMHYRWRS